MNITKPKEVNYKTGMFVVLATQKLGDKIYWVEVNNGDHILVKDMERLHTNKPCPTQAIQINNYLQPLWVQAGDILVEKYWKSSLNGSVVCISWKVLGLKWSVSKKAFFANLQKIDISTGSLSHKMSLNLIEIKQWKLYEFPN